MLDISLEDDLIITDPLKKFIQEIDVIMNTVLTSVLGQPYFGSEFEQFLWSMFDASESIAEYARKLVRENCPSGMKYNWDVGCSKVYDQEGEEYYYLIIAILNQGQITRQTYVLHNYGSKFDEQVIKSIEKN